MPLLDGAVVARVPLVSAYGCVSSGLLLAWLNYSYPCCLSRKTAATKPERYREYRACDVAYAQGAEGISEFRGRNLPKRSRDGAELGRVHSEL